MAYQKSPYKEVGLNAKKVVGTFKESKKTRRLKAQFGNLPNLSEIIGSNKDKKWAEVKIK